MAGGDASDFQRNMIFGFYLLLLVAGILIYIVWGLAYDTWYPFTRGNIGVYTIYIPLIAFGLIGIFLYRKRPAKS